MSAFTDAARAEAERRWGYGPLKPNSEMEASDWLDEGMSSGFVLGAQWQAEQEPTEEQVEVMARMATEEVSGCDWESFGEDARDFHRGSARRRLTAALRAAYATGGTE